MIFDEIIGHATMLSSVNCSTGLTPGKTEAYIAYKFKFLAIYRLYGIVKGHNNGNLIATFCDSRGKCAHYVTETAARGKRTGFTCNI